MVDPEVLRLYFLSLKGRTTRLANQIRSLFDSTCTYQNVVKRKEDFDRAAARYQSAINDYHCSLDPNVSSAEMFSHIAIRRRDVYAGANLYHCTATHSLY